jgi:Leucine-rich repeat (LRR) protein
VNVETLSLSENAIDSFVSASFHNLPKLKTLDLSYNRVNKLVERLFYNLHMLEILNISGNSIGELNPDVFRDIWRLKELRCRECGLKTINPLLYALLPDLTVSEEKATISRNKSVLAFNDKVYSPKSRDHMISMSHNNATYPSATLESKDITLLSIQCVWHLPPLNL